MMSTPPPIHRPGTNDGWHGKISPSGPFKPEAGRYHLYIGLFCPFAHRVNLVRHLAGLQSLLPLSIVKPYPRGNDAGWPGWSFPSSSSEDHYPGSTPDALYGAQFLHELYHRADAAYTGRFSVPLLWDAQTGQAVNNESLELVRDLPTSFASLSHPSGISDGAAELDLYPEHLRAEIDEVSKWMHADLNTGVYKAGFATDQATYDANVVPVFRALNRLEELIAERGGPYILGKQLTEVDVLAYPTVVRFDAVYHQHFKTNLGSIRHDYPQVNNWLKNLYWNVRGFRETTDFRHIKENYTKCHEGINPRGITPMGPIPNVEEGYEKDLSKLRVGKVSLPEA